MLQVVKNRFDGDVG
jgi:hypothetical protein